jgi:hypothetical protein
MRLNLFFVILLLSIFTTNALGVNESLRAPNGKHIMPDGKCGEEEWEDASEKAVGDKFKLLFKKTREYVYICVKPSKEVRFAVDLYVAPEDKKLYTLHVSAKLGERVLEGEKWKEWTVDWPWWEISDWWANTLRPADFQKREFLPHRAIEFQIGRNRFIGKEWRVMLDLSSGSTLFPEKADNLKTETWVKLDLRD